MSTPEAEVVTTETTEAPTIESIAAEYNLVQESPTPQPVLQSTEVEAGPRPDPVTDPDGFGRWLDQQTQQNAVMRKSLNQTLGELNAQKAREASAREEQELNALVDTVHKGLDEGVSKNHVKYALADRYNSNKAFKAILDNRNASPEAVTKAINAILPELRREFSIKADPQIAENQRAMSDSTSGSVPRNTTDDRDQSMIRQPQAEFEREWQRLKGGY